MHGIHIDELAIPATLDAEGGDEFARAIELGNHIDAITYGTPDLAYEPAEELPYFNDRFEVQRMLVARLDGQIVGRAVYTTHTGDEADAGWLNVQVLPEYARRGIGRALADAAEALAIADGKAKALVYHGAVEQSGPQLTPASGAGSLPADGRAARLLQARGYSLEQVERVSRLALPVDNLTESLRLASAASGPDYVIHTWTGRAPERWLEDVALLNTRMSTDAPTAGLEEPEDVWTVDRVKAADDRNDASPRLRFVAAAEHIPTGHLVGFTVISTPQQKHRAPAQYATLVLREHRGHRLGMLLKVANLAHLQRVAPGHPSIITFNAEENRHMLDVNDALGFVPIAVEGAWRKDL